MPLRMVFGWVEIVGYLFSIEEFVFFILIAGVTLLCWYEFFSDDRK